MHTRAGGGQAGQASHRSSRLMRTPSIDFRKVTVAPIPRKKPKKLPTAPCEEQQGERGRRWRAGGWVRPSTAAGRSGGHRRGGRCRPPPSSAAATSKQLARRCTAQATTTGVDVHKQHGLPPQPAATLLDRTPLRTRTITQLSSRRNSEDVRNSKNKYTHGASDAPPDLDRAVCVATQLTQTADSTGQWNVTASALQQSGADVCLAGGAASQRNAKV